MITIGSGLYTLLTTDVASMSLRKALDAHAVRQRTIANNIANLETPGFKRSSVSFEEQLKQAVDQQDVRQALNDVQVLEPTQEVDHVSPSRPDGNNVSIEMEISDLSQTELGYRGLYTLLKLKGSMVKTVVNDTK